MEETNHPLLKNQFLNKLKQFGLNSYQAKLWLALLARGVATAGELSDISNVPRSRAYDVLEALEKKGFIVMKIGKPIKYIAVPPDEVLNRVRKRIIEDAEKEIKDYGFDTSVVYGSDYEKIESYRNGIYSSFFNIFSGAIVA